MILVTVTEMCFLTFQAAFSSNKVLRNLVNLVRKCAVQVLRQNKQAGSVGMDSCKRHLNRYR